MPLSFERMSHFAIELLFDPKIPLTFTSVAQSCSCHQKMSYMDKHSLKRPLKCPLNISHLSEFLA